MTLLFYTRSLLSNHQLHCHMAKTLTIQNTHHPGPLILHTRPLLRNHQLHCQCHIVKTLTIRVIIVNYLLSLTSSFTVAKYQSICVRRTPSCRLSGPQLIPPPHQPQSPGRSELACVILNPAAYLCPAPQLEWGNDGQGSALHPHAHHAPDNMTS